MVLTERSRQFLADLLERIQAQPDAETLLQTATVALGAHLQVATCVCAVMASHREVVLAQYGQMAEGSRRSASELLSALGRNSVDALRAGRSVYVNDIADAPHLMRTQEPSAATVPVGSLLAAPLISEGRWIASLIVASASSRRWSLEEIFLLEQVTARISMAVQNIRLSRDLARSAQDFETLFEIMPVPAFVAADAQGTPGRGNAASHTLWNDPVLQTLSQIVPASDPSEAFTFSQNGHEIPLSALPMPVAARTGKACREVEFAIIGQGGRTTHLLGAATPLLEADGTVRGCVSVYADTTRTKQQEKERHDILAAARCLVWQADITESRHPTQLFWDTVFVDAAAAREWLPIEVRPGEEFLDARRRARLPEDLKANDALGTASIRAGQSYSQEFRCRCADGSLRWLHEDIRVETIVPGQRWWAVGICTDVSERVRSDEARQACEQRLQEVLHAGKMGTWEWDMAADSMQWSSETERLYGLEPGAFAGTYQACQRFVHPEDREVFQELITKAIYSRNAFDCEHRVVLADGAVRWMAGKGQVLYDEQGRPVRMLGTVADITDRKRLEQQLLSEIRSVVETNPTA